MSIYCQTHGPLSFRIMKPLNRLQEWRRGYRLFRLRTIPAFSLRRCNAGSAVPSDLIVEWMSLIGWPSPTPASSQVSGAARFGGDQRLSRITAERLSSAISRQRAGDPRSGVPLVARAPDRRQLHRPRAIDSRVAAPSAAAASAATWTGAPHRPRAAQITRRTWRGR